MRVHLASYLREFAQGSSTLVLQGAFTNVRQALEALWQIHPALRHRVLDETGKVRQHVNIFIGQECIRQTGGLDTPIQGDVELSILPSVSGG